MERLKVGVGDPYDPIEASLHVGRYALALPFAAGRRVLDVACGEGYGSWLLTDGDAAEVVGVDNSSDAIDKARATFRDDRLRFETSAAESLAQVLPLAHFDLIVSLETIEHVADPEAFLLALRQVATPDAIFVLTCPNDHWYYGDREGNPHHLRRLTFDQFKSLAIKFLGNNVRWLLGSATLGFAAVSADQGLPDQATGSKYTQVLPSRLTLRVPSGEDGPSVSNVSYFIGVWNAPDLADGAGAYHSVSMDYYSKMMWTATSMEQLAELNSEVSLLRTQRDQFASEISASNIERASLSATLALEIREREILGVQAAALRRENDILSSQLLALRNEREIMAAEVVTLGAERNALQTSLDWHIARVVSLDESLSGQVARSVSLEEALSWHVDRVVSLDESLSGQVARSVSLEEALSWHVSRVQNLESEGPRRLVRRALSRTIQAWPPLTRLVSRLRRHNASQAENT